MTLIRVRKFWQIETLIERCKMDLDFLVEVSENFLASISLDSLLLLLGAVRSGSIHALEYALLTRKFPLVLLYPLQWHLYPSKP